MTAEILCGSNTFSSTMVMPACRLSSTWRILSSLSCVIDNQIKGKNKQKWRPNDARAGEIRNFVKRTYRMPYQLHDPRPVAMEDDDTVVLTTSDDPCSLIVWNDEVNTFEWVIQTLMEVCDHSLEQAEQCAMLIHTKGKYAVKQGSYDELKPLCDAITDRGIGATIEILSES
jgi:ATP-dependent Clp protease adaptor protein ClpS